ncbi:MAG: hypothetical protein Kow0020_11480 [Wenzhouxiangellaceae bacterium]
MLPITTHRHPQIPNLVAAAAAVALAAALWWGSGSSDPGNLHERTAIAGVASLETPDCAESARESTASRADREGWFRLPLTLPALPGH